MSDNEKIDEPTVEPGYTGLRHIFANAEFNEISGVLTVAGSPVAVEPRPLRLLAELLRRVNEVVTKDELFETLWAGRPTVDHVLANAVSKLRTALGEEAGARIVNLPRVGYRLNGPVRRVAADAVRHDLAAGQPVPSREGFVLERPLGPPGRSQVWLARHAKLGQAHVFKFADDTSRLSAIKREYTLYRLLQAELGARDDFARVLDTQFLASPYFLECEYGGMNLLEWADEGGRLASLPLPERLEVFLPIARAVAAAHSVGVIHKDLKPANVLMAQRAGHEPVAGGATRWQMRLTDFGSGRLLDPSRLEGLQLTAMGMTQAESLTAGSDGGTLMYLAPELLAGHSATVQSDVYALGMLLYQLVAGDLRRPLASGWEREIEDPLLREDIRAATDGRPHERLKSADALLERLSSLDARRAAQMTSEAAARAAVETAAQLQRIHARRPWVAAAVASLVLGLGVSVWFAIQARSALEQAEQQAARANAIDDFMNKDLLSGIDVVGVGKDGMLSMRAVLARAAERAGQRFKEQPHTEAVIRGRLADLYYRAGLFEEALGQYGAALAHLKIDPQAVNATTVDHRFGYATLLAQMNRLDEAQAQIDAAEQDRARLPRTEQAALEFEAAQSQLFMLATAQRYPQALAVGRRLVELDDQQTHREPLARFNVRVLLADLLYRVGQFSEAETVLNAALKMLPEQQVGAAPTARARIILARIHIAAGKTPDVEEALIGARDVLIARMGPNDHDVAVANTELGNLYDARGEFARSASVLQDAYAGMSASLGKDHANTRIVGLNLAISEINAGRAASGLRRLDEARPWFAKNLGGEEGPVVQAIDFERARALTTLTRPAEALPLLARLKPERLAEATPARDWADRLQAERGRALIALGRRAEGLLLVQAALPKMEANGSSAWVLESYRRVVNDKAVATSR